MYYSHRDYIMKLFSEFNSKNLIRDISLKLETETFMPDDIIYSRRDQSNQTYFVFEGKIKILNKNGNLLTTVTTG